MSMALFFLTPLIHSRSLAAIKNHFYVLAGPNYVQPFKTGDWQNSDVKGDLGAQAGAGFAIQGFMAELEYQTLNPKFEAKDFGVDESRLWGFLFKAGATF
jgi:hypothetical protein